MCLLNSVDEKVMQQTYSNEEATSPMSDSKHLFNFLSQAESEKFEVLQVGLFQKRCKFCVN